MGSNDMNSGVSSAHKTEVEGSHRRENVQEQAPSESPPLNSRYIGVKLSGPANVSYWNMPYKGQILLLVLCRISEPIAYGSAAPYLYYMIKDFGYENPAKITALGAVITSSFALGQTLTGLIWGNFSDKYGRKPALMLGLLGTAIAVVIFGTAHNIYWAVAGRMLSGLLNGNVGVMRTMIAEIISDRKEYQSRAFAILPITYNLGNVIGPIMGGLLANPAMRYPGLFGWSSLLRSNPYLLPNLVPIPILLVAVICTALFAKETGSGPNLWLPVQKDPLLQLGRRLTANGIHRPSEYQRVETNDVSELGDGDEEMMLLEDHAESPTPQLVQSQVQPALPEIPLSKPKMSEILTRPIKITVLCYAVISLHDPAFMQIFPLFLSTPRMDKIDSHGLKFNGGLGFSISTIGLIMSILGIASVACQLIVYPRLASKYGNAWTHRMAILLYVPAYSVLPFLSLLPGRPAALGVTCATLIAALVISGQTSAFPPLPVLVTNASPSPTVLGQVHGLTASVTSAARCIGPFILGNFFSLGVKVGVIGLAWWMMTVVAMFEVYVATSLRDWDQE